MRKWEEIELMSRKKIFVLTENFLGLTGGSNLSSLYKVVFQGRTRYFVAQNYLKSNWSEEMILWNDWNNLNYSFTNTNQRRDIDRKLFHIIYQFPGSLQKKKRKVNIMNPQQIGVKEYKITLRSCCFSYWYHTWFRVVNNLRILFFWKKRKKGI